MTGEAFHVDSLLDMKRFYFCLAQIQSRLCTFTEVFIQERLLNTQITVTFIRISIITTSELLHPSIHPAVPGVAPLVPFAVDGHMITCDRGHRGSSGVSRGLPTSCPSNHLFIWLTDQLGPALAGGESQKGKVRGERRVRGQSDPDWVTFVADPNVAGFM